MSNCRGCKQLLDPQDVFVDLGSLPLVNSLLSERDLDNPEIRFPLRALVCRNCLLAQLPDTVDCRQIFGDSYPFYSGLSSTWMAHCKDYADTMISRFKLNATSRVLEIGSNDGTMLRRFQGRGIPSLGVEPCSQIAQHALMEGLPTVVDWWGTACAGKLLGTGGVPTGKNWRADLVIANNVLAHVPDPHDFLQGVRRILSPGGVASFEVPYIGDTIDGGQWDQVYHEHYSYFSLRSLDRMLTRAGLFAFDVERIPLHGGSVRVYAGTKSYNNNPTQWHLALDNELDAGLHDLKTYLDFAAEPAAEKRCVWDILSRCARQRVIGYGASAKATVFANYCGIGPETIECIADITPAKWGCYQPGTRIPIRPPGSVYQPDAVINFAWNWREESEANIRRDFPDAQIIYLRDLDNASCLARQQKAMVA